MSVDLRHGIWVADVLMGGGKTTAAINYINDSGDDERFIFLTPYETEFYRVVNACKDKKMVTPDRKTNNTKLLSLRAILKQKRNVVSSHALFDKYTPAMIDGIREGNYTLFLDEVYDIIKMIRGKMLTDFNMLYEQGLVGVDPDTHIVFTTDGLTEVHRKSSMSELIWDIEAGRVTYYSQELLAWSLPTEVLKAFRSIIILTYFFEGSPLRGYLDSRGFEYKYISTRKTQEGKYKFCFLDEAPPPDGSIPDKIHILDHKKLNAIGKGRALSKSWYENHMHDEKNGVDQVRKNLYNVKRNVFNCKASDFMWGVYAGGAQDAISTSKDLKARHVVWNKRAVNDYGNCHYLAYVVNLHKIPTEVTYFNSIGVDIDEKAWVLSNMVQWIWRSAIRNGEEIWIYLPSERMRNILTEWMEGLGRPQTDNLIERTA